MMFMLLREKKNQNNISFIQKEKKSKGLSCFQVLTIWNDDTEDTSNENNQEPDLPHSDW
jgi:hypothetical protein